MMQFLIAAPSSGSGKTTVACAVLAALKKRGADPCAFKSGPDYIDPMFHRSALQVDSHNLDLFLSNRDMVRAIFARYAAGHGAAVCEGAMGFYDGQGLTTRASAWELADTLGLPVLLVVQPKGASVTLAAQIQGLMNFRKNSHVSGILLNDCSEKLYKMLKALLERETGLPVLGYLPHLPQAAVESRHLGLKTADEIADLQEKIALLADALVLDWQRLAVLTEKPAPEALPGAAAPTSVRIAVAKDEAFCFTYAETLDALRDAGAELVLFSPVQDAVLPENIGGLYLPGGYPELYAQALSENKTMRASIRQAVQAGLPTAAECGGFLYLGRSLEDADGKAWPMADVLPGDGIRVGRLVRFGVSNFYPDRLIDLCQFAEIAPMVNQVETHVFQQQRTAHEYMKKYGVQHEAWGPFAEGKKNCFTNPVLVEIGEKYGKTAAQTALRFLIQSDVVVIPKSTHKERMEQNLDVFDFSLSEADMEAIRTLDEGKSLFFDHYDPSTVEMLTNMGKTRIV